MNHELRWIQRFQNFDDAYRTFGRVFERYQAAPGDEIIQMALIQAFEFTFEIAWKTMKDYLEHEGYDGLGNNKQAVRVTFQAGLIAEPEAWMMAIAKRNMISHVYNAVILQEIIDFIQEEFYPLVNLLHAELAQKL